MTYYLKAQLTESDVRMLKIGDTLYISGEAFTCRSRLHRWVFDEGHEFPLIPGERNVLIHNGPIVVRKNGGFRLVSFMPTSSIRFEKWGAASVQSWKLRLIIGKTTMGKETADAMKRLGCVHASPRAVTPNLWTDSIKVTDVRLMEELGSIEATWLFTLDKLGPFVVDMDCEGNNLFDRLDKTIAENRTKALKTLGIPEDFDYTKLY